ncbi:MAG: hypothetical protein KKC99_08910, partial [Proteobacteria bacterium]|nr:hypothetical protein [Pseudomonadota bacterium]
GWCCIDTPCEVSHRLHGYTRRCPELLFDEEANRYICLLMAHQTRGTEARRSNFEGQGCCNPLGLWRNYVRNRDEQV